MDNGEPLKVLEPGGDMIRDVLLQMATRYSNSCLFVPIFHLFQIQMGHAEKLQIRCSTRRKLNPVLGISQRACHTPWPVPSGSSRPMSLPVLPLHI